MKTKRHRIAHVDDIPVGERKLTTRRGLELGIFNVGGEFRCYRNVCPHAGAPVCLGKVCGTSETTPVYEYEYGRHNLILRCPWHGWEFDLRSGEFLVDPKVRLRSYPVIIEDGEIFVELPEQQ